MTQATEIMTPDPVCISPSESLQRAAQLMDELNVGALPVCEQRQVLGIITDRDIAVRAVAAGQAPATTRVGDIMSETVRVCAADADARDVLAEMARVQIRRLLVVDNEHRLIGVVSLGDFAARYPAGVESTLRAISLPARPERRSGAGELSRGTPPAVTDPQARFEFLG